MLACSHFLSLCYSHRSLLCTYFPLVCPFLQTFALHPCSSLISSYKYVPHFRSLLFFHFLKCVPSSRCLFCAYFSLMCPLLQMLALRLFLLMCPFLQMLAFHSFLINMSIPPDACFVLIFHWCVHSSGCSLCSKSFFLSHYYLFSTFWKEHIIIIVC